MRIAILTPTLCNWSGIDRVVEKMYLELKKDNEVKVFTFQNDMKTIKDVELIPISKNPFLMRIWRLFFFVKKRIVNKYAKIVSGYHKVIAFQYPMTLIAKKAKEINKSLQYQYYDCGVAHPHLFRSFAERTYMNLFKKFLYKSISNIDSAISISRYLSDELYKDTGFRGKVKLLEADTSRFNKDVQPFEKQGKIFLYVGRISPHKGIHLLIQAFNKVLEKIPDAKLWIIGKNTFPKYQKELEALIKGSVEFKGFVEDKDLPRYYATCDACVTCTLWEGFDLPIVESNACGKPSIAFDICSHPEVLKIGKLIPEGDTDKFAEAMIKI